MVCKMYYGNIKLYDTADGVGIRTALYVSGCTIHCKGCHNKETWNFKYGKKFTEETLKYLLDSVDNEYTTGLSILGGEPFDNQDSILDIILKFRERFGNTKDIWIWSGYRHEDLLENGKKFKKDVTDIILNNIDYLVDGEFIEEKRNTTLKYRGSENQNIIKMR